MHSTLLLALFFLAGCGYSAKEIFPQQYRTVAVPIFENRTFYRGVELDLTEALVKQIETRTPYKVAPAGSAGTVLQGAITRIEQVELSRGLQGGLPQQLEVLVQVAFEWKNLRTGRTIRERRGFEAVGRYVPAAPVGQPIDIALHQAVERLARDIVSTMQADWGEQAQQSQKSQESQESQKAQESQDTP